MWLYLFLICICFISVQSQDQYPRRFPSAALSNWNNFLLTWTGPRLNPNDPPYRGTGVNSLRIAEDFGISGIKEDSFALFLNGEKLTVPKLFDGDVFLSKNGELRTLIETYDQKPVSFTGYKSFFVPIGESFYVVKYSFTNPTDAIMDFNLLDYVISDHPESTEKLWGWFYPQQKLFMIDETKTGGFYFSTSNFSGTNFTSFSLSASAVDQFQHSGKLDNSAVFESSEVTIGFQTDFTLSPGDTKELFFFRTLQKDWTSAIAASNKARSKSPKDWISQTSQSYAQWLSRAKYPDATGERRTLYENSLVHLKNSQMPGVGPFVASFHPKYGYKSWSRDGSVSAMIMDAAGYHEEAELFLRFMANAELREDGAFHTCYDWFTGEPRSFVEPEYDATGTFLTAVYHHYIVTGKNTTFLTSLSNGIDKITNFLQENVGQFKFAPPGYSIWEESSDGATGKPLPPTYFTFTQAMCYSGLYSSSKIYLALGDSSRSQLVTKRANEIHDAINDHLWIQDPGYFARGIWSDDLSLDTRADSSSVALVFVGATTKERSESHLNYIRSNLTQLEYGLARYWGDIFFYTSKFNPGGQEVGAPNPPWGVVTMFTAWAELELGAQNVENRLNWMVDHAAPYLQPVGEAIDGITGNFVMSSCPDLYEYGGVYIWTSLLNERKALGPNPSTWE